MNIDGVHVSTSGVTRIQTEETVGEQIDLTEEERLDLHDRKEFIDILEKGSPMGSWIWIRLRRVAGSTRSKAT